MTSNADSISPAPRWSATTLLVLLVVVTALGALASGAYYLHARQEAADATQETSAGLDNLRAIALVDHGHPASHASTGSNTDFTSELRSAAVFSGLSDQLLSIEPGQVTQARDSDVKEMPVFLELKAVTVRQVVTFLRRLTEQNARVIPRDISLSVPPTASGGGAEVWTADVTLAFPIYGSSGSPH